MIIEGIVLGTLSFSALATLYHKMPDFVKGFCQRHPLLTDALSTVGTYLTLGSLSSSVIAAIAAAWVGLLFEIYMIFLRNNGTHATPANVVAEA